MGAEKEKHCPNTSGHGESAYPGGRPMLSDTKGWAGVTGQGLGDIRGSVWQDRDWRVRSSA